MTTGEVKKIKDIIDKTLTKKYYGVPNNLKNIKMIEEDCKQILEDILEGNR